MSLSSWFRVVLLLLPLSVSGQTSNYLLRYFYQSPDTLSSPDQLRFGAKENVCKFLQKQGLTYVDSAFFEPEKQHGNDSIRNVTHFIRTSAFFIRNTEVSNSEYLAFARAVSAPIYLPDTTVWTRNDLELEVMQRNYLRHPAYAAYPVVGVSWWHAEQFCIWKTAQLNEALTKAGFKQYRAVVSLPTESEWQTAYQKLVLGWLNNTKGLCHSGSWGDPYWRFASGCGSYRCNFKNITSDRGAELSLPSGVAASGGGHRIAPCQSFQPTLGVYHLMGNVAEWTQTAASGSLFNQLEYIYTTSGNVIRNVQTRVDSAALRQYQHDTAQMANFYVVKGGSWNESLYFLEPASVRFMRKNETAAEVGFRYVVRIYAR